MEVVVYGHWGFALLMFPTAAADFLEYERFGLIDAIAHPIESGKCKVFSINSISQESWLNHDMHPYDKGVRHQQYNQYVVEEVLPFIWNHCYHGAPIVTSGASLGAYHSVNTLLRLPHLIAGTVAMSGVYDLKAYTRGYFDENVYFNSPVDYMPNLTDEFLLSHLRGKHHIHLVAGQGAHEDPGSSSYLSHLLWEKGIPNELDLWGHDVPHDWPSWRRMLPHYLETRF
jgi:esterase/lipase superfamily enzyme